MLTVGKPDGPMAERRACSVLFCESAIHPVVGAAGPEGGAGAGVWDFAAAQTVIDRSGAVVEKVIGYPIPAVTTGSPKGHHGASLTRYRRHLRAIAGQVPPGVPAGVTTRDCHGCAAPARWAIVRQYPL